MTIGTSIRLILAAGGGCSMHLHVKKSRWHLIETITPRACCTRLLYKSSNSRTSRWLSLATESDFEPISASNMPAPQDLPQTPEVQRKMATQRQQVQQEVALRRWRETQKIASSKNLLQRLKPEAAGRLIRNMMQQKKTSQSDSTPSSPEGSMSGSSSSTLIPKHLGPGSSDASSTSTATVQAVEEPTPDEKTLKRKRDDDEEEVDEVAERVKRLKMQRRSLWQSFDDSQFNLNSGLLYDAKLWDWYW